ncbi:uncharacterized protein E6C27_scaffold233G00330 [Cucumis melo var. makuwa]|uniref:Integrase catalytic domain-containing protein n=1 Tax=Cucumis melo var. makuwa TaxID=1194695 RepID=A0A5A7USV2_CUCMM|nr:uncharacterized protein E6C27_scaffold233G00330 [Cucumis melo var. makuwa]
MSKSTMRQLDILMDELSNSKLVIQGFNQGSERVIGYNFTTHIEFKSLKIHEQSELSSIEKKLLWEGHVIPVSRKGLGYKLPEPIRITRKGKEKVVESNHIIVEEVDSMEEKEGGTCQALTATRPSAFERLSVTTKKNVQIPRAPIFNCIRDGSPHVKAGSSIDTKKKELTSRVSAWYQIKHTNVKNYHDKELPCELRMNPLKCAFGVTSGKFLNFIERSLGTLLAQEEEKGKERALYYLSRTLVGAEVNYSLIEKMCLALFFAIDKLRHYMQAFTVHLVAKTDPINAKKWRGAGIVLIYPEKHMLPYNFALVELCSNNVAQYQALIIGLQMALDIGVSLIEIYGDSKLIIDQLSLHVMLKHVPKTENKRADALANLTTALTMSDDVALNIPLCQQRIMPPIFSECQEANDSRHKTEEESIKALKEVHAGICGAHQSGPKLQFQLRRMSYYWHKMVQDSMDYAKKCEACQYHANFIHQPPKPLHSTVASWPFEAWELDLVGPMTPKSSAGHSYILAATDYFSKWVETIPLREAKKENVANFIRTHIIYRYGIPHRIVTNNGRQFSNSMKDKLCEKFKFKQYKSFYVQRNCEWPSEAFNKTLCNFLKKIVSKLKRDWQERIEVVLPFEREIPSLRMAVQEGLTIDDNVKLRLQELEALDEERLEDQQALECYQTRMSKACDKHVKPRSFQVGDLVLTVRRLIITTRHMGNKFTPKWDGPYIVKEVYTNGAHKIVD